MGHLYENRNDAGKQLGEQLKEFLGQDIVVLAIPRGGLPVGAEVARFLKAPLDVALTKKIGHPYHREYAVGAVSLDSVVLSETETIPRVYIEEEISRIRETLRKRQDQYYKKRKPVPLVDKVVIVVDDGIATGNTLLATVQLVSKQHPAKIIVAIPVAPLQAVHMLEALPQVDEVICLATPMNFRAVGQFYLHFYQVSDEEAIRILEEVNATNP
ncbi:phosphoribosyltransferase [Lentiprolixibacter aurantiacus]|uniref:Phosphoribosyltransferase family protein n=1 Tax=Lentiprolixibacter aurantiacus TaxID=2993939 RepID=A0AAE3MNQ4_9FLAO|nr:phosphoribosyltransferase family protein [Lentiprolixibacter aurantiacus]MCX2720769.1 phosphoribosyltransferase family protein [Lentiprolixibacter aurantiacus]